MQKISRIWTNPKMKSVQVHQDVGYVTSFQLYQSVCLRAENGQ